MPCTLDEVLGPPTTPEGRSDEKALLEQLVSFLSGTDESELVELDKALGIDKIVQVSMEYLREPSSGCTKGSSEQKCPKYIILRPLIVLGYCD